MCRTARDADARLLCALVTRAGRIVLVVSNAVEIHEVFLILKCHATELKVEKYTGKTHKGSW